MAQPDEMIELILINNTRIELGEIAEIMKYPNPLEAKLRAAYEVTRIFHGEVAAKEAQEKFEQLVRKKEVIDNVPEVFMKDSTQTMFSIVRECLDKSISNSKIRRLFEQGSIRIDGEKRIDEHQTITLKKEGILLKVGKKQWFKVKSFTCI
jgi:tyrosyl-tRNA synthetase